MVQCNFCNSKTQPNYIYTQCNHFVCLDCASTIWDKKYSFKCCNKITFLEEQTCLTLQRKNKQEIFLQKDQCKENIPITYEKNLKGLKINRQDQTLKLGQVKQSVYLSQLNTKSISKEQQLFQIRKQNGQLLEMQNIMSENINKIKMTFQSYRRQLQRRQEILLREVYNKYSQHLANINHFVQDQDVSNFKNSLDKLLNEQLNKNKQKQNEGKPDKILQKLEYNQIKMKQKIHRHYELLK